MKQPHHAAAPAVPVSMPQLVLDVRADGTMTALLDGQPVTPPVGAGPWRRAGFARIIDHATRERQVPVRVTVHESDGSTFTDILPATRRSRRQPPTAQPEPTTMARRAEPVPIDGGHGFLAGEDVAIALVTGHTDASHHGQVRALLDPTIIAATHAQEVVLIGRVSGTITIRDLPSSPAGRHGQVMGDELTNIALAGIGGVIAVALLLRAAGTIAAFLTGAGQPDAGIAAGVGVLFNPGDPAGALGADGLSSVAYWIVAGLLLATITPAGVSGWVLLRRHARKAASDPHRQAGTATPHEAAQVASARALTRRAGTLRPSLSQPTPADLGYRLGSIGRQAVWASVEDSMLIVGPPRSGKGLHVVIPAILDAPGAVVTTSTRPDNLTATLAARRRAGGKVAVFDPQHLAEGIPAGLRWSPIRGCESPQTAMIRATGLASATGLSAGGVEGGDFWEGKTRSVLQSLLHAAALDHRSPTELFRWTLDPVAAAEAVAILTNHPNAATGWADSLHTMIDADPKTRDSIWQGVSLALASLADPRVLDAVSPADGESFDPETFIRERGTLYLLATGAGAGNSAALVAAFVEDLVETARRMAARSAGARLDPPLLLALDEIGNLAPLPSLPTLMAEGGGTGITTMAVLQSLAQARDRWSEHQANAIWDASIVKIVLGGASNSRDLQDLSTLIGDRDEYTDSSTVGDYGSRSNQRSVRRVPIMAPDRIRTLPFGTAVTLLRAAPPIITDLRPWPARPDGRQLAADRKQIAEQLQAAAPRANATAKQP